MASITTKFHLRFCQMYERMSEVRQRQCQQIINKKKRKTYTNFEINTTSEVKSYSLINLCVSVALEQVQGFRLVVFAEHCHHYKTINECE